MGANRLGRNPAPSQRWELRWFLCLPFASVISSVSMCEAVAMSLLAERCGAVRGSAVIRVRGRGTRIILCVDYLGSKRSLVYAGMVTGECPSPFGSHIPVASHGRDWVYLTASFPLLCVGPGTRPPSDPSKPDLVREKLGFFKSSVFKASGRNPARAQTSPAASKGPVNAPIDWMGLEAAPCSPGALWRLSPELVLRGFGNSSLGNLRPCCWAFFGLGCHWVGVESLVHFGCWCASPVYEVWGGRGVWWPMELGLRVAKMKFQLAICMFFRLCLPRPFSSQARASLG